LMPYIARQVVPITHWSKSDHHVAAFFAVAPLVGPSSAVISRRASARLRILGATGDNT
jgi:hypothetical protein